MNLFEKTSAYIVKKTTHAYHCAYNRYVKKLFKSCGEGLSIAPSLVHMGLNNVSIGNNFRAGERLKLRTFDCWEGRKYIPQITIGNNVNIETDCHISAINKVSIGDNVLIASFVYISDHSHGNVNESMDGWMDGAPIERPLYSKGPIIIENNVWLGEKVTVLPGVHIGRGAIIGANSVVTKSIPPYAVAVGSPAKVIKMLK